MKDDTQVQIRVTVSKDLYQLVIERANQLGLYVNHYVRHLIIKDVDERLKKETKLHEEGKTPLDEFLDSLTVKD